MEKLNSITSVKVNKNDFVAESKNGVLLKVKGSEYTLWFNKKFIQVSQYTNIVSIGIVNEFAYQNGDMNKSFTGESVVKTLLEVYKELNKEKPKTRQVNIANDDSGVKLLEEIEKELQE